MSELKVDFRTVDGPEPYVYVEGPKLPSLTAKQMDERKRAAMRDSPVPAGERLLSYKEFCGQAARKAPGLDLERQQNSP